MALLEMASMPEVGSSRISNWKAEAQLCDDGRATFQAQAGCAVSPVRLELGTCPTQEV
jgi:hypothetical protein